ncbi:RNA polymerase sigma-70 factor [candidate division KSB1 bacterium]|nr:RNA polymerase sigma-70 factor [candidate division KSB1 bacterium]
MSIYENLDDEELAKRIADSDVNAFRALYFRYYPSLYHFVRLRTHCPDVSEDLLQDVFTRLWETRKKLNPCRSTRAYLFRIAHNKIIDAYRKKAVRKTDVIMNIEPGNPESGDNPELTLQVQQAVQKLPDKLAVVFMLSRYEGLKYAEIAQACGISVKAVEKRLSKALHILRRELL